MIVEYMENGDLNEFLQKHVPENTLTSPFKPNSNKFLRQVGLKEKKNKLVEDYFILIQNLL